MSKYLVIIPTYNEIENIERMVHTVMALEKDIDLLVVDDNSPDGTAVQVDSMMAQYNQNRSKLNILKRQGKNGLGTAYIAGFHWALEKGYEYICEMDCDFSHNPDDLVRLREACVNGADMAIGSRYVKDGKIENWPKGRVLMSYFASVYVRIVLGVNIHDTTAGFKCYTRRVLEKIQFEKIKFVGYAFQIEMKYTAYKLGFKIAEVPITFTDRQEGVSKMSKGIFKEAFWGVLQMRFTKHN